MKFADKFLNHMWHFGANFPNYPKLDYLADFPIFESSLKEATRLLESMGGWVNRKSFDRVEHFCLFVGHSRSGHSLIGALLDAHPHIILAHELDVLGNLSEVNSRNQLFYRLLVRSRLTARNGRSPSYSYKIPSQYQGEFKRLKIIGDKSGGFSSIHLKDGVKPLKELIKIVQIPVKIIHVKRHPLDNISTMARKGFNGDIDKAINRYFKDCNTINETKKWASENEMVDWIDILHERSVIKTKSSLAKLLDYLNLEYEKKYLHDTSDIVFGTPNKSRNKVKYRSNQIKKIRDKSKDMSIVYNI